MFRADFRRKVEEQSKLGLRVAVGQWNHDWRAEDNGLAPCIHRGFQRFHGLSGLVRLKTVEIQKGSHPIGSAKMQPKPISPISPRTSIARIG
jgi:hypothetical protein